MLYKLLIVDDEKIICEGLTSFIDWESLGFEVVACLNNGKDAIDYVDKNDIDVVLTDIKMTFKSGLDLAHHVYSNKPYVKVVIISGHKDFDYAKQAMSLNVVDYILKPTQMEEVSRVFTKIKKTMDAELEEKERLKSEKKKYSAMISILREQFFTDLLMGALRDRDKIEKRMELLNFDENFGKRRCHIIKLQIKEITNDESMWQHSKEEFNDAIRKIFNEDQGAMDFFTLHFNYNRILIFAVETRLFEENELQQYLDARFKKVEKSVKSLFGIETSKENLQSFDSVYEVSLKGLNEYLISKDKADGKSVGNKDIGTLIEKQKLMLSYITAGDSEAVENLFYTITEELVELDFVTAKNYLIELFSLLSSKLKSIDPNLFSTTKDMINYNMLLSFNNIDEMKNWGKEVLNNASNHFREHMNTSKGKIIEEIKKYIQDNYNNDISLSDVGDHVYLSTVYLSRFFKQSTGENFIDYLIKIRMESAMELLKKNEHKVYEVGAMVGYKNIRYFSNLFKKHTGVNPSQFRKIYLESSENIEKQ